VCLAAIAIGQSARFPWVLATNRDEFFDRASAPLAWWQPAAGGPAVLSGRDLSAGGTWLGVNAQGRLALVTNVREPGRVLPGAPSRGDLVLQCLQSDAADLDALLAVPRNGFNLFTSGLSGRSDGVWLNNRPPQQRRLQAGVFGLSNAALDTPWPKVLRLKQRLVAAMTSSVTSAKTSAKTTAVTAGDNSGGREALMQSLFEALADAEPAADAALPDTGVPLLRERQLSSAFIRIEAPGSGVYGTRCSTVVVAERSASGCTVHVVERSFTASGSIQADIAQRLLLDPLKGPRPC